MDTRILVVGDVGSEPLAGVLAKPGRSVTRVEDVPALVNAVADGVNVVVLDLLPAGTSLVDACREVRATAALATVPLLALTASDDLEERIRLLEAGADDVMLKPIDERELDARVEALDLRNRRVQELRPHTFVAATRRPGHRVVAVFSPKGGVGTTTVAVNLALALAAREPDGVAIVDLTATSGHVALHLNVRGRFTVADLLKDTATLGAPESIRSVYTVRHASGLHVLLGTASESAAQPIDADAVGQLVDGLLGAFSTLVIDAGSHLDDRALAALDQADDALIVVTPDFPTLKAVHALLELARERGLRMTEPTIVLNEIYALQPLTTADVENALQRRVAIRLPYDALIYLRAANQGTPLFAGAPTSQPARRFDQLAAIIVGEDAPQASLEPKRRGFGALFSRS